LWLERLNTDHENLLAAVTWTEGNEARAEKGLVLADALYRFWYTRGHYETARATLERTLRAPGAQATTKARADALFAAAGIAMYQGRYSEARDLYTRCLATWRTLGAPRGVASALLGLGLVDAAEGRYHEARLSNRESLDLYRQAGDTHSMQYVLHNLGDVVRGESLVRGAHLLGRRCNPAGTGRSPIMLGRLALVTVREGSLDRAAAPLGEALRLARELKAMNSGVAALDVAGELAARTGHGERAARLLGCADALRDRAALLQDPGDCRRQDAVVEELRATLDEAAFMRAWELDRELSLDAACASALEWLGQTEREWADTQ
jgi:non-specific serine/threonine protein kinase